MQRGQPAIAGLHAVAPLALQVIKEGTQKRGIQILKAQVAGLPCLGLRNKHQQQPEGVTIGGHGMRAGPQLRLLTVR